MRIIINLKGKSRTLVMKALLEAGYSWEGIYILSDNWVQYCFRTTSYQNSFLILYPENRRCFLYNHSIHSGIPYTGRIL
jgi:hypothetical protein